MVLGGMSSDDEGVSANFRYRLEVNGLTLQRLEL
jgi:hypothetical protein